MRIFAPVLVLCFVPLLACADNLPNIQNPKTLSGDEADACSAVLCLSNATGRSVSECHPSLQRYYSITGKDAAQKRKNFLDLCPSEGHGKELQERLSGLESAIQFAAYREIKS